MLDHQARRDDPPHAQPRKCHLGKTVEIDDHAVLIQRLERRQRRAFVTQIAVDLIFDNRHAILRGQCDQTPPCCQIHRHTRRVMKSRHQVNQLRSAPPQDVFERAEIESLRAHRHADKFILRLAKKAERARISRILDDDFIARFAAASGAASRAPAGSRSSGELRQLPRESRSTPSAGASIAATTPARCWRRVGANCARRAAGRARLSGGNHRAGTTPSPGASA